MLEVCNFFSIPYLPKMNIAQHPACQPTNLENHFESEAELYNNMFWLLFTKERGNSEWHFPDS